MTTVQLKYAAEDAFDAWLDCPLNASRQRKEKLRAAAHVAQKEYERAAGIVQKKHIRGADVPYFSATR